VIAFLVLACVALYGQGATVLGRVTDPSGGILAGAEITATQETTQVAVSTRTNGEGQIDLLRYLARLQAQAAAFRAVT